MASFVLTIASMIFIATIPYLSWDGFIVESRIITTGQEDGLINSEPRSPFDIIEGQEYSVVSSEPISPPNDVSGDEHQHVEGGTRWAVLVAGSKGYYNYRHQADICHAYQIFKKGGVKDENIIVFMYDDIAMNPENPRPGIIINSPHGDDVYKGVPKDYIKEEASLNNLFAVLLNNKSGLTGGSGKVLNSGPDDHVFIYYTDHGGPGIVGMPTDEDLYAKDLINALKKLHATKSYKKMVIYMEACESGSMFDGLLPEGLNIYTTTAAKPNENSYATYCPYDPHNPPPKEYDTCLGDLYSVSWLEDSDKDDLEKESLEEQYRVVKKRTTSSHVMQYGDIELDKDMLVSYIGSNNNRTSYDQYHLHPAPLARSYQKIPSAGIVDQRDADIIYFKRKVATSAEGSKQKLEARKSLDEILAHRKHVDQSIEAIGKQLFGVGEQTKVVMSNIRPRGRPLVDDWDCYKSLISTYTQYCGPLKNYGLKYARGFANMCNAGISRDQVATAAAYACVRPPP